MIHYEDADWKIARTPPWENFEIKWSKEIPTNSDVAIYTEGSKLEGKVSFAFIVVRLLFTKKFID